MNKKTLTKLEYHKIIDILIEQATSFGGKERCKRLKPMTSLPDINTAQEQTAAAFTRIIRKGRPSFGSCNPVGESLKRLEVGAALGSGELLRANTSIRIAKAFTTFSFPIVFKIKHSKLI